MQVTMEIKTFPWLLYVTPVTEDNYMWFYLLYCHTRSSVCTIGGRSLSWSRGSVASCNSTNQGFIVSQNCNISAQSLNALPISLLIIWNELAYWLWASSRFIIISLATGVSSWCSMECSMCCLFSHKSSSSRGPGCLPYILSKSSTGSCFSKAYNNRILNCTIVTWDALSWHGNKWQDCWTIGLENKSGSN